MKSLLIRLLCLLLAFTLASCGEIVGSPEPPATDPTPDTPTEPPTTPEGYTFTVTLRYNGAPFLPEDTVTVEAKRLMGISVTKKPDKLTYLEGENFVFAESCTE